MAASYPGAIKSFTTKTDNVDDVLAAHVNDLQDEVVALETACGVGKVTSLIQQGYVETASTTSSSTTIPNDDTIPQDTEGAQILSLAHTMKVSTNKLLFIIQIPVSVSAANAVAIAVFKAGTAGAIYANFHYQPNGGTLKSQILTFQYAPGSISAITYNVRVGGGGGTIFVNGDGSTRILGGVMRASMQILELASA